MNLSACSFVVLMLWVEAKVGFAQDGSNFITWDDLMVDNRMLHLRDFGAKNQNRVIVVDKNGRGDSLTVQGAIEMVPLQNTQRVKIHILPGVYSEKIYVPASKPFISLIGDPNNPSQTVITWHDKASNKDINGGFIGTWKSASVTVESDYFCASGITFENTVVAPVGGVEGYQAVAFRSSGDRAVFYKVRFLGSQDTLLDESGTHYFFQCFILGATDFIFGNARSLYQECTVSVSDPGYAIAAQHRDSANENTGLSFVNCTITGTGTGSVYLGRAWGDYSRVVYANSLLDINVTPGGWEDWKVPSRHNTVMFGEYGCTGRGADRSGRVAWSKALDDTEARPFLGTSFISGEQWLRL
ncbi:hypothetical protein ACJIZ3_013024 [Penstemon smallii]|uniref:Pectinesterase n=1 Tax=Penstemon smallii TaxID=265156 RepID=A0ABD3UPT7_9LAMI